MAEEKFECCGVTFEEGADLEKHLKEVHSEAKK